MTAVRTPTAARSVMASRLRAPATMPSAGTPRSRRFSTMRRPRWPEAAVTTKDMVGAFCWRRWVGSGAVIRQRSEGEQPEGEDGDGEHQWRQRHREVLGVAHPQVARDGADEVGDQADGGGDAERFDPQPGDDPEGAGDL